MVVELVAQQVLLIKEGHLIGGQNLQIQLEDAESKLENHYTVQMRNFMMTIFKYNILHILYKSEILYHILNVLFLFFMTYCFLILIILNNGS